MRAEPAPRSLEERLLGRSLASVARLADRRLREAAADACAEAIRAELGELEGGAPAAPPQILAEFRSRGCVALGPLLGRARALALAEQLRERPCYPGHVARADTAPAAPEQLRRSAHHGAYAVDEVLAAPGLLELANHPRLLALAAGYLGCLPSLYAVNCFWSFAGHEQPAPVAQHFHRDPDDFRFCTLFAFLTDVDESRAPHSYVVGSHDHRGFDPLWLERAAAAGLSRERAAQLLELTYAKDGNAVCLDPHIAELLPDRVARVTGAAGTCFAEDTFGLHKGGVPTGGDRLVFWARYGLGPNLAYALDDRAPRRADVAHRLPSTPAARYINRLLVQW